MFTYTVPAIYYDGAPLGNRTAPGKQVALQSVPLDEDDIVFALDTTYDGTTEGLGLIKVREIHMVDGVVYREYKTFSNYFNSLFRYARAIEVNGQEFSGVVHVNPDHADSIYESSTNVTSLYFPLGKKIDVAGTIFKSRDYGYYTFQYGTIVGLNEALLG